MNHKQCPYHEECDAEAIIDIEAKQCNYLAEELKKSKAMIEYLMAKLAKYESPPPAVTSNQGVSSGGRFESGGEAGMRLIISQQSPKKHRQS